MQDFTVNRFRTVRGCVLQNQIEALADRIGRDISVLGVGGRADYWRNVGLARISSILLMNFEASELERAAPGDIFIKQVGEV